VHPAAAGFHRGVFRDRAVGQHRAGGAETVHAPPRLAEFPEIVQSVSIGQDELEQYTPPPPAFCPSAEFPEIMQLVSVGLEPQQYTPPPNCAVFPVITQLVSVGEEL